jgi:carboxylate-amine ligase
MPTTTLPGTRPARLAPAVNDRPRLTIGVEEEFLLLDATTGRPAPAAPGVVARLDGHPGIKQEFMSYQLEIATGICNSLEQLRDDLVRLRETAADAAAEVGCRLAATGLAPHSLPGLSALTDDPRYRELVERYGPELARSGSGTCGCHVHVGVPSREVGIRVIGHLRPWLASLLAVSANSPIVDGRATDWASRRYRRWSRWPSVAPPRAWRDAADYDEAVRRTIRSGAALDERGIYFHARLSARYPTVEVRVMDTCLSVDDTVLVAALVRALAAAALAKAARGVSPEPLPDWRIRTALARAAREGLYGAGIDPGTGRAVCHRRLVERMLDHALHGSGADSEIITELLYRFDVRGTGAERQRAMWAKAGGPEEFARLLADATLTT